ncbi:MAG: hypothetical protein OHK0029_08150 [Armatimonadaceae bacterium]
MGIPERIYRIGKAYVNQIRDRVDERLDELEDQFEDTRKDAERELDSDVSGEPFPAREDASPEAMMRRAEARIAAARRDLESRGELRGTTDPAADTARLSTASNAPVTGSTPLTTTEEDPNEKDYKLLGIPVGSDLPVVQAAYEKLAQRCDPRRFPEGSAEQKQAQQILERVNTSYEALRRRLNPTESRFGKLELE